MERLYTENDLARWQTANNRKMEILRRRIGDSPASSVDVQGLNMLSISYVDMAFSDFALGDCENALEKLRCAVRAKLRIFELYAVGNESAQGYNRTGEFQTILMGFASGDLDLARRFSKAFVIDNFSIEHSPDDSNYISLPIRSLALGKLEEARAQLSQSRPTTIDPQFAGYIECLAAVADADAEEFRRAIKVAESYWLAFMAKMFRGHPQSACFAAGLGFQRLAEATLGTSFDFKFCCSGYSS